MTIHLHESPEELHRLTAAIRELNTRWARQALSLWQGRPFDRRRTSYTTGFEKILTTGNHCRGIGPPG
jgi:hypothetical protein